MGSYKYIIYLDFNEFIVFKGHLTLKQLAATYFAANIFRNSFFHMSTPSDPALIQNIPSMIPKNSNSIRYSDISNRIRLICKAIKNPEFE